MTVSTIKPLLEKEVEVEAEEIGINYFSDERDIALAFMSDGFCPFKKRSATCWPLIPHNLNLTPDIRTGPKKDRQSLLQGVQSHHALLPIHPTLLSVSVSKPAWQTAGSGYNI